MRNQQELRPYEPLVETLGKCIGIFGLFIGCSFIYGYFYQLFLFMKFDADWLVSMYPTEALVRIGIPWVLSIAAIAAVLYFIFPKAESLRVGVQVIGVCALLLLLLAVWALRYFGVTYSGSSIFSAVEFLFYALCVAGFIPWGLKKYREKHSAGDVASDLIVGVAFSCVFIPYMMSSSHAGDINLMPDKTPVVWSGDKPVGVLLGIADSKFIVLSCSDFKTVKIYEPSEENSVASIGQSNQCQNKSLSVSLRESPAA